MTREEKPTVRRTDQTNRKKPSKKKKRITAKKLLFAFIICIALAVVGSAVVYIGIMTNGKRLLAENAEKMDMPETSIIYDVNGNEITKLYRENRELVNSLDEIPKLMQEAFIATEDKRFEEHGGVDVLGIGRALVKDIIHRGAVEGGSTITQQLAKNLFTNAEGTLFRKATEMSIALAMEKQFSKDEILKMYLDRIYFGNGAYGVKAAAKRYFGKQLSDLKLEEMATLAAIPKAPSYYNPIDEPQKSKDRRAVVLQLMFDQGYITAEQKAAATAADLKLTAENKNSVYQSFVDYAVKEITTATDLTEEQLRLGGYKIYTTMDAKAQKAVEDAYKNDKLFQKDSEDQKVQSSMVIYDHHDGGIVAMIGGRDYAAKGLNRTTIPRQPGSSFKPIAVYAPALESNDYNPYSMLVDEKMSFADGKYSPRNYNNKYQGQVTMSEAVKQSINIPAVWLLDRMGVGKGFEFAKKMGIPLIKEDRNLAIALGGLTNGATPIEMARAYGAFANGGELNKPHSVIKVVDSKGKEVLAFKTEAQKVMSEQTAYYMTVMMQGVVNGGTGKNAKMNRPVAGKTGSTQIGIKGADNIKGDRDVWFVGYTPEWTAAVWMGYDKTDTNHYITVGSGATAKIFSTVMTKALEGRKVTEFQKPKGVSDPVAPPKTVTDLKAQVLQANGQQSVSLSWTPVPGTKEYKVFRKESDEDSFKTVLQTPNTTVEDTTVEANKAYQYYVTVYDPDTQLESEPSNVVEVLTLPFEEGQPIDPGDGDQIDPGNSGGTDAGSDETGGVDPGTIPDESGSDNGTDNGAVKDPGNGAVNGGNTGSGANDGANSGSGKSDNSGSHSNKKGKPKATD